MLPTLTNEAAEIKDLCAHHRMPELGDTLTREGASMAQANLAVLNELARRGRASGGHRNFSSFEAPQINAAAERDIIVNSLVERMGGKSQGETIRHTDVAGLATRALELAGHTVTHRDGRDVIIQRAMGTSDFANLMGIGAAAKALRMQKEVGGGYRRLRARGWHPPTPFWGTVTKSTPRARGWHFSGGAT